MIRSLIQLSVADPGFGGGGGGGGHGWWVWLGWVREGGTPPAPARGYVSSPIGVWGGAPEALRFYYIPIMKRVRKSCFHRLGLCCLIVIKRTCLRMVMKINRRTHVFNYTTFITINVRKMMV